MLDVARKYPDFPIVLETVRECLQDVYDVPTLTELMGRIAQRRVRLVEVETPTPSPFAASLLFGYVGAFMYEGDSPLAERRAAALSLDSTLLAELLGRVELRELLDPQVIAATAPAATPDRGPHGPRRRGRGRPAAAARAADRGRDRRALTATDVGGWLDGLHAAKRALTVSYAGQSWWVAIEDIGRLRDGVGVAVPVGVPTSLHRGVPPIRSASCSAGTPAPAVRSPRTRPRPGSAWACASPPMCSAAWRSTASWCAASSSEPQRRRHGPQSRSNGATQTC